MKYMVGFDVAKNSVVATLIDVNYKIIVSPITIDNTTVALAEWLHRQQDLGFNLTVCCESTGYYHYSIIAVCAELEIVCRVLNPIITKQAIKATIRGKKTDRSDAILIARLGLHDEGVITANAPSNTIVLLRISDTLQSARHSLTLTRRSLVERDIVQPDEIVNTYDDVLQKLDVLVQGYRQAALIQTDPVVLKLLTSIPGIGDKTASVLIAELKDITRFNSLDALVAFTGLDPRVRQSGTSLHRNTRLTKRGSPSLRRAVFSAANVSRQHDPAITLYYQKKRAEGRTYTEAMMPTCRKLLARIYAVWKRQTPYVKQEAIDS